MARRSERRVLVCCAEGKLVEVRLADDDRARVAQTRHDRRVRSGDVALTDSRGRGRRLITNINQVFQRDWHAV
jgi:hypothetical protein